ncbi:MAG: SIR2 family protein [Bryobacterales bacterium]|nr:SIR2 family protein [Bryobacterales bacterium]
MDEDGTTNDLLAGKTGKEVQQRLQALISEWLRMENLVVLTGAGTSVSSGGKTMDSLECAVLGTLKLLPDVPDSIIQIIDARLAPVRSDETSTKCGFEDWLSYIVSGHFIGSMKNSPFVGVQWRETTVAPTQVELSWFVESIRAAIFAECALTLPDANDLEASPTKIAPHLAFLAKLVVRDSNLGRAHLFTLNYDTLFEQACELLGIQYFDGYSGRAFARFDPSVYGLDIYYPGEVSEGRVRRFDKFLHLYKLHGSIHWQIHGGELRARHPDLSRFNNYGNLELTMKAKRLANISKHIKPIGILPTSNKLAQTLTMPFAHLFRAFQIRLSVPQTFLLVLGYGFGDDHVTQILESALMNPSLVMLVVEPDPTSATIARVRQYRDLGKRVFVLTSLKAIHKSKPFRVATFDDFTHSVMPDIQWLDDLLRLRRFEKQIQASNGSPLGAESKDLME